MAQPKLAAMLPQALELGMYIYMCNPPADANRDCTLNTVKKISLVESFLQIMSSDSAS